jgi:hypothetical protein
MPLQLILNLSSVEHFHHFYLTPERKNYLPSLRIWKQFIKLALQFGELNTVFQSFEK